VGGALPSTLKGNLQRLLGVITVGLAVSMLGEGALLEGAATLVVGFFLGHILGLERRARRWASHGGVIAAVVLFCTGPMTVLGSIKDAFGEPDILLVKSMLDGTVSVLFASIFGLRVALAALLLLLIQGGMETLALLLGGLNIPMNILNATGGLILLLIGLNLLELMDFPTADTLPSLLLVPLWSLFS